MTYLRELTQTENNILDWLLPKEIKAYKPFDSCPATGTAVREIVIKDSNKTVKYVLAISKAKKVLWLHHIFSGFNQLIPLTAFYDELLRTKHIRDAKFISHPASFFDQID